MPPNNRQQRRAQRNFAGVGRHTYGHDKLTVLSWGEGAKVSIGAFCSVATGVTIMLGGNHRVDWATTYPFGHINRDTLGGEDIKGHPATNGDVVIGNDVWLGNGATIMSGVTIGDGAVVAARALVTRDVAPYDIVGGNPAKVIRARFPDDVRAALLALKWWDLPDEIVRDIAPLLSAPPTLEGIGVIRERIASLS